MQYTPDNVVQLIRSVPWKPNNCIRLLWLRCADGSRDALAQQLSEWIDKEAVVPLVLRFVGFNNANAVLSDALTLFEANRTLIEALAPKEPQRLTFLVLSKEDFRLVNASSLIELPDWFPLRPLTQTFFSVADLGQAAEVKPLNFPDARMDNVAELLFALEKTIASKLWDVYGTDPLRVNQFVAALQPGAPRGGDARESLNLFTSHLGTTCDPRAYRPNAAEKSKFLAARILKLILGCTPKQVAAVAAELGMSLKGSGAQSLRPTFFAVMWRPPNKISPEATNWHAIMVAFYQAYQLMNAHAHAGEFPAYAVSLQYANSVDLRQFLTDARDFVDSLT